MRLHSGLELVEDDRVVDHDELRRRPVEPRREVADLVDRQPLEVGVAASFGRELGDVQLVLDVAVEPEPALVQDTDRLPRVVHGDRNVPEPPAAHRFRDHRALVADDGVVQARLEGVGPDASEHPPGDEDDVDSHRACGRDRGARPRAEDRVLSDQRPVEVARERLDVARKVRRESQLPVVRNLTSASICGFESVMKLGMIGW